MERFTREVYERIDYQCVRGSICLYCKLWLSGLSGPNWIVSLNEIRQRESCHSTVLRWRASKWPVLPAGSSFSSLSTASQWQMDPRQKKIKPCAQRKKPFDITPVCAAGTRGAKPCVLTSYILIRILL